MSRKLYVGGLAWATTDEGLGAAFAPFGKVVSAKVVKDRETGRSRGFGFVEYETEDEAKKALTAMNNTEVDGRRIRIDLAQDKPPGPGGPRRFGPGGGGPGGGGGGFGGPPRGGGFGGGGGGFGRPPRGPGGFGGGGGGFGGPPRGPGGPGGTPSTDIGSPRGERRKDWNDKEKDKERGERRKKWEDDE